ncbi:MAG: DUF1611 domain-containing protein [Candidatus Marinimicrobia bacterium]|nr:DUF1611 domain-containing protein [Candidatus Neomarinimicrobiota bacterium]
MAKYAILAEGSFSYIYSKTGNTLIRYKEQDVVGVIDSRYQGKTVQDVLGYGGDIPVVSGIDELFKYKPDMLVLGNAPQGGRVSGHYKSEIFKAISHGLDIISGMHEFISDDPEFIQMAEKFNVIITDLRKPPKPPHFPKKSWSTRKVPVLLTVGSDCDTGKMTTAWELTNRLQSKGINAKFIGTGQTGILLCGQGVPVDAVVGDFMAGEIEYVIDQNLDADIILVEGQGAITNMLYSGVTLGLIHGAMPDYYIMCHEPIRETDVSDYTIPDMKYLLDLHLSVMKPFRRSEFLGINLLTHAMSEKDALLTVDEYEKKYNCITSDIIRFGGENIVDAIVRKVLS